METDVLVIGGGGAGCAAALAAAESGAKVMLATKLRLGDSNTVMAEGGIQASLHKDDTPQQHYDDTLKAGHHLGDPELVAAMVNDAPDVVRWLIQQGMQFDLDKYGDVMLRRAGGTSGPRVAFYRDYTGLEMIRVLREAVFNSDVEVLEYSPAVELFGDQSGDCAGAVLSSLKSFSHVMVRANAVILTTGGIGRMHINGFPTSNHFGATGDGLVLAYRLGARLRDLDSFQYHPTGLAHPRHLAGSLITEGIRSAGAHLLNARGERFIGELKGRDFVSSAILRECAQGRGAVSGEDGVGVWLDTPRLELISPGLLDNKFPKLVQLGRRSGIDPKSKPLLVYPTLHYQNGGVHIDADGRSTIPGLYCVGEVSGGIHGRNRIMGNALLDIICFGRRAGLHASGRSHAWNHKKMTMDHLSDHRRQLTFAGLDMRVKSPMLFPSCAKFDSYSDYDGFHKSRR
jgi:succinate dehydrogenase / fumarate reductase flavoprotein subunit/L-aspartate oxidase